MFFFESLGTSSDSEPVPTRNWVFLGNRTGCRNCGTAQAYKAGPQCQIPTRQVPGVKSLQDGPQCQIPTRQVPGVKSLQDGPQYQIPTRQVPGVKSLQDGPQCQIPTRQVPGVKSLQDGPRCQIPIRCTPVSNPYQVHSAIYIWKLIVDILVNNNKCKFVL